MSLRKIESTSKSTEQWRARVLVVALLVIVSACSGDKQQEPQPSAAEGASEIALSKSGPATVIPAASDDSLATVAPTPVPSPTPPSGTITLWHSWTQREGDALAAVLADFQSRYPNVTVETLFVAHNDLLQSYAQAAQAGGGPDLVLAPNWWLTDVTTLGLATELDDLVLSQDIDSLWPAAVDNLRVNGKLYGLPTNYDVVALYYNKQLIPEGSLPESLDELLSLAQAREENGIGIYANLFHLIWGIPAFGSQVLDESGLAALDHTDGTVRFLQWLVDVNSHPGSYVDTDYGMLIDRFKNGEFAFFVDGPWSLRELRDALGQDLGVAALPRGPAGESHPWLYADAIYVNPSIGTEQSRLAFLLAQHLTSADSGSRFAKMAELLPANKQADLGGDTLLAGFARQAAYAQAMPHGTIMDEIWRYGGDMILKAIAGAGDLTEITVETATLINEAAGR